MRFAILIIVALLSCIYTVFSQTGQSVLQSGSVTPGHVVQWTTDGTIQDAGTAATGTLTSIGVTASGPAICQNSDVQTAAGWQRICLSVTTAGGAQITVQNFGTASALPLTFSVNGVTITPVSCSGSPTGSFASVNGIVTHC
jgi:hypothetical protein